MKIKGKDLLIIGGLGAVGILAANSIIKNAGGSSADMPGSLGGEDDSLTSDDNPFAKIDPNYQYPDTSPNSNNYFITLEDGSIVPVTVDPNSGDVWDGSNPETPAITGDGEDNSQTAAPGEGALADPNKPKWYDNPLAQGGLLAAGYIAAETTFKGIRNKVAPTSAKKFNPIKPKTTPIEAINSKLGFSKANPQSMDDVLRAKYTTPDDFSVSKGKAKPSGKMTTEAPKSTKTTVGKVGKVAVKGLIITDVVGRSFEAWDEYGKSYLDPRESGKGPTIGSTAKAVTFTGAAATSNIFANMFGFATGLVYRPPTKNPALKDQTTGWFATERDIGSAIVHPVQAVQGMVGWDAIKSAFTRDKVATQVGSDQQATVITKAVNYNNQSKGIYTPESVAPQSISKPRSPQSAAFFTPTTLNPQSFNTPENKVYKAETNQSYSQDPTPAVKKSSGGSSGSRSRSTSKPKVTTTTAKSHRGKSITYTYIRK